MKDKITWDADYLETHTRLNQNQTNTSIKPDESSQHSSISSVDSHKSNDNIVNIEDPTPSFQSVHTTLQQNTQGGWFVRDGQHHPWKKGDRVKLTASNRDDRNLQTINGLVGTLVGLAKIEWE